MATEIRLSLETVTPLFLGGARQEAELRPASVRGALRYWLRAAIGGGIDGSLGNHLEKLSEKESAVFGATDHASPVIVRFSGALPEMGSFNLDKDRRGDIVPNGHNYFYYSTKLGKNDRVPFQPYDADKPARIQLILQNRRGVDESKGVLKQAAAAAWLLTHLGGLGTRARRCGGSVQALNGALDDLPPFEVSARSLDELRDALAVGLKRIRSIFGSAAEPTKQYDIVHPDVCKVWVIGGESSWKRWKDAVEEMGSGMKSFRESQEPEYNHNKYNAIFGLPILKWNWREELKMKGLQRRSSPLWLRVTRLASGEHAGVATLFKAEFTDNTPTVGGGYKLIEDFIASLPRREEVKGW